MKSPLMFALALVLAACGSKEPAPSTATSATPPSPATTPEDASPAPVPEARIPPSFDCATASSDTEKAVCASPELSALDSRLAEIYAQAEASTDTEKARLTAEQRGWIKGRDDCWKSDDSNRCITEAYMTRTVQLQLNSGKVLVPSAVEYACDDDSKRFTVVFYNELDPKAAVVTWGDDQAIVFPQPSGSGAKYGREGLTFWEHQGEAKVDFYGNSLTCKAMGKGPA